MPSVSLTVNGQPVTVEVENRTLLVQLLRDRLSLTGTHIGCDTSQCGACVVHLDGVSIKSCTILAVQCENAEVVTIEGIASSARLHPMQEAFNLKHGLQCGYCTPGMIMSLIDLLRVEPHPDEHAVRKWLEGNICRCTGYQSIIDAALECAQQQSGGASAHV